MVTDRPRQIGKWVAENHQHICHLHDIWHAAQYQPTKIFVSTGHFTTFSWHVCFLNYLAVGENSWRQFASKGMSRPDGSARKCHQQSLLGRDVHCSGNGELIVEKWKSIERHAHSLHRGHFCKFPRCACSNPRGKHRRKRWMKPGVTEFQYCPVLSPVVQYIWKVLGLGIHVGHFIMNTYARWFYNFQNFNWLHHIQGPRQK